MPIPVLQNAVASAAMSHVLVVEDSRSARDLIVAFLHGIGHIVIDAVATRAAAEQALATAHVPYLCAVADLGLPDAPRGEVLDTLRAHGVPIIVLSGTFDPGLQATMHERGIVDYVLKSETYELRRLVDTVRRLRDNPNYKVLVVDDCRVFREHTASLLCKFSYRSLVASNGREALEVLKAHPDVSLVISDVVMPEMDGFELIAAIRRMASWDELPVIGVSERSRSDLSAKLLRSGANDFMPKPFEVEEFRCRVAQNLDLRTLVRTLKAQAQHDMLTDLPNRRQLFERGADEFALSMAQSTPFGVALFDIDHFKRINDAYGHMVGDSALQAVAKCLARHVGIGEIGARYGGEEFAFLLRTGTPDDMLAVVDGIRSSVENTDFRVQGKRIPLTVSAGVAAARGASFPDMLAAADAALYRAKLQGRNRVEVSVP